MKILKEELAGILKAHKQWAHGEPGGMRADLRGADLRGADLEGEYLEGAYLRGADLRGADLRGADLEGAYLEGADLRGAYLEGAYLRGADLRGAYLRGAYLEGADLEGAYLEGAYLRGAYLRGADLRGADLRGADLEKIVAVTRNCPEEGAFVAWKSNKEGDIIKVEIPADAKRLTAIGSRKCRAEYVRVLEIVGSDGTTKDKCGGWRDKEFIYTVGENVCPDSYDNNPLVECTNGIHFFISRQEAVDWVNFQRGLRPKCGTVTAR